jgi:hypothetical protein
MKVGLNKMVLYAVIACALFTAAGRSSTPEKITVSGKVVFVGNAPFVEMVIHDSQGKDWFIEGDDREILNEWVDREVTIEGFPHETDLRMADDVKTFKRYTLSQISITGLHE